MTKRVLQFLFVFILLTFLGNFLVESLDFEFPEVNYWDVHGVWFLIFITIFPRLTLLFSSVAAGSFFWWLGFIFYPRVLVAILATFTYWETNPILVVISWLVAFGGESTEKVVVHRKIIMKSNVYQPTPNDQIIDIEVEK